MLTHLAIKGGHRGGEHHHAAFAVFHGVGFGAGRGKQACSVVGANQVHVDDFGKVFQGRGIAVFADHAFGRSNAGNLHQDTRCAMGGGGLFDRRLHALWAGDVALDGHGKAVSILRTNVRRHALGVVHVDVEYRHFGA